MTKRGASPIHRAPLLAMAVAASSLVCASASATDVFWTTAMSGNWMDLLRWTPPIPPNNGNPLPTDTYDVTIAAAGAPYTVSVTDPITIRTLKLNSPDATLDLSTGGTLAATMGIMLDSGSLRLSGGAIRDSAITGTAMIHAVPGATSTLDNVLLRNPLTVDSGAALRLRNEIRLSSGSLSLLETAGADTRLLIDGDVSITRPGAITFDGAGQAAILLDPASATGSLSIGPESTIRTATGNGILGQPAMTLSNTGLILAIGPSRQLDINAGAFNNAGDLITVDGATLVINSASFTNTGVITIDDGTLVIHGSPSASAPDPFAGTINRSGGTLALAGPFFNAGPAISLDTLGPIELRGATLGRAVTGAGPAELIAANGVSVLQSTVAAPVRVNNGATLSFSSQAFKNLTITGGTASLTDDPARQLLQVTKLDIDATGTLDLNDNDLIIRDPAGAAALPAVVDAIKRARGAGDWLGAGLTSTAARNDPSDLLGIAAISNDRGNGTPVMTTFAGQAVDKDAILVTTTLYGDTNLDGKVSLVDFLRTDRGAARGMGGWANGDFDYSGTVDGADYFLLDRSFLNQPGPSASVPSVAAVPEPGALALGLLALAGLRRRRVHRI